MPEPMIVPTTMAVASNNPSSRTNPVVEVSLPWIEFAGAFGGPTPGPSAQSGGSLE